LDADLQLARTTLLEQNYNLVVVRDGVILLAGQRHGVVDLLEAVARKDLHLRGAAIADIIIGKAAALLSCHAGFRAAYTPLISEPALAVFESAGIEVFYDRLVPLIFSRTGDGPCPLEKLTQEIDDPDEALVALNAFL
jgi:hypothetical protein